MGGKHKKVTTGFRYLVGFHAGIGARMDALLDFRVAQKAAWTGRLEQAGTININAPQLFGGDADQGGIVGDMDVLFGMPDQQPNDYLLSTFGPKVPGWRGVVTAVYKGGQFGSNNPYAQKFDFLVEAIKNGWGLRQDASECWYPEKAAVPITAAQIDMLGPGWEYQIENFSEPNTVWSDWSIPTDGWLQGGEMPFATGGTYWPDMRSNIWLRRKININTTGLTLDIAADNGCVVFANGVQIGASNPTNANIPGNQNNPVHYTPTVRGEVEIVVKAWAEVNASNDAGNNVKLTFGGDTAYAMNPAHILYFARTCPDMGREPTAAMDDDSYRAAADWFYQQGIGLCTDYDASQESVDDFCSRVGTVAGCSEARDPTTGKWVVTVVNGIYDIDSLPILTDDDVLEFSEQPTVLDQAVNSVSVEYYDPDNDVTRTTPPAQMQGLIATFGVRHQVQQYHEVPTAGLAARFAQRDLQQFTTPTHAFDLTTTPKAAKWRMNSNFRLQLPKRGIADMVCILGDRKGGTLPSGAISISAVENVYTLPQAQFTQVEPNVDTRPPQTPSVITIERMVEAPYVLLAATLGTTLDSLDVDAGFVCAMAVSPAAGSRDFTLQTAPDGGSYANVDTAQFCAAAQIVEGDALTSAPATDFTLTGGADLGGVAIGSAALWDNEIVRVDALDAGAGTLTLGRGCADTLPAIHDADSRILFFGGAFAVDDTQYTDGETVDARLLTNTGSAQLDPATASVMSVTLNSRQSRPYPPAHIQIAGSWYPASVSGQFTVTWAYRDRVAAADQLIDTAAASSSLPENQRYGLRFKDADGNTLVERDDIGAATATVELDYTGDVTLELWTIDDNATSLQTFSHTFAYTPPSGSPTSAITATAYTPVYNGIIYDGGDAGAGS